MSETNNTDVIAAWKVGRLSVFWTKRWRRPRWERIGPFKGMSLRGAGQGGPFVFFWYGPDE